MKQSSRGVLKIFPKYTGKHLWQSLFFNKVPGLFSKSDQIHRKLRVWSHLLKRPATLLKKRLWHRRFPVNFVKFLRTPNFIEHLRWLLHEGLFGAFQKFFGHCTKKCSFPLRISLVNVGKYKVSCGFVHIY